MYVLIFIDESTTSTLRPTSDTTSESTSKPTSKPPLESTTEPPLKPTSEPPPESIPDPPQIVSREEWGAYPPIKQPTMLKTIPLYVIISHTAFGFCREKIWCINSVKQVQMIARRRNLNDIEYNFLVGGDGNVYEGRGWDVAGDHTPDFDDKSIGIAFIGDFTYKNEPTIQQIDAAIKLLEFGVHRKRLRDDYRLLGQSQVMKTDSPGSVLSVIKTWKHWTAKP